jgi:cytokinesis protein
MQLYLEDMVRTYDDFIVFCGEDPSDENARKILFSKVDSPLYPSHI